MNTVKIFNILISGQNLVMDQFVFGVDVIGNTSSSVDQIIRELMDYEVLWAIKIPSHDHQWRLLFSTIKPLEIEVDGETRWLGI